MSKYGYQKTASSYERPTGLYAATVTRVDGDDVYVEVPYLTADFEHGPILYVGGVPPAGTEVFVGFLNGDPDTVIGILPTSTAEFLPLAGGTMTGDIDLDGNDILDAVNVGATNVQPPADTSLDVKDEQGIVRIRVEDSDVEGGDIVFYKANGVEAFRLTQSTGTLTMSGPISGPTDPTAGTHVGDRDYNDARYLGLAGGTLTGDLTLNAAPDTDLKAATKKYVDDEIDAIPAPTTIRFPVIFSGGKGEAEVTAAGEAFRFKAPFACTLVSGTVTAGVAPTGSAIICDARNPTTTMFSTLPQVAAGSQDGTKQAASVTAIASGDVITGWITQVGSTTPGENVTFTLEVTVP